MLIFGHKLLPSKPFVWQGFSKENIACFNYDESLIQRALQDELEFCIFVQNEDEILLANALKASYIVIIDDDNLAKKASKMAEFYLFDSKILLLIEELKNLSLAYHLGVDGVICKGYIQGL